MIPASKKLLDLTDKIDIQRDENGYVTKIFKGSGQINNIDCEDIILYSNGCPRCKVLKEKLNASNIKFSENSNIDKMLSMGINDVPVLEISKELLNFAEAVKWINGRKE